MMRIHDLFDLEHSLAGSWLDGFERPWEALSQIREWILRMGPELGEDYLRREPGVWIHKTARIAPTASVNGPCILGPGTRVRHGAFIRGAVLTGENCLVGNSVELKNVILFDAVQVPHFNYAGDSILGWKAHMGAGSILSNLRADQCCVRMALGGEYADTGLRKCGSLVGDRVEIGCNSVLNPGTVAGRDSIVQPGACVRGFVPEGSIWKTGGSVVRRR